MTRALRSTHLCSWSPYQVRMDHSEPESQVFPFMEPSCLHPGRTRLVHRIGRFLQRSLRSPFGAK